MTEIFNKREYTKRRRHLRKNMTKAENIPLGEIKGQTNKWFKI
jgi:hypothetical protein